LDGDSSNGEEIVFGSGNGAPQSFFRAMKLSYDPSIGENGAVTTFRFLTVPPRNLNVVVNAFSDQFNPASGEVFVETFELNLLF